MIVLPRPVDEANRALAPVRGPSSAGARYGGAARQIDQRDESAASSRYADADVEILGARGGIGGRPVVSVPSSAFFAQHIGQNPDARNRQEELFTADAAYRDALDLGVALHRPAPLSVAV